MNFKKILAGLALANLIFIPLIGQEEVQVQAGFTFPRYQVEIYLDAENECYDSFPYFILILADKVEFNPETGRLICEAEEGDFVDLACVPNVEEEDLPSVRSLPIKNRIDCNILLPGWPVIKIREREKGRTIKSVVYKLSSKTRRYEIVKVEPSEEKN